MGTRDFAELRGEVFAAQPTIAVSQYTEAPVSSRHQAFQASTSSGLWLLVVTPNRMSEFRCATASDSGPVSFKLWKNPSFGDSGAEAIESMMDTSRSDARDAEAPSEAP